MLPYWISFIHAPYQTSLPEAQAAYLFEVSLLLPFSYRTNSRLLPRTLGAVHISKWVSSWITKPYLHQIVLPSFSVFECFLSAQVCPCHAVCLKFHLPFTASFRKQNSNTNLKCHLFSMTSSESGPFSTLSLWPTEPHKLQVTLYLVFICAVNVSLTVWDFKLRGKKDKFLISQHFA